MGLGLTSAPVATVGPSAGAFPRAVEYLNSYGGLFYAVTCELAHLGALLALGRWEADPAAAWLRRSSLYWTGAIFAP